MSEDSNTRSPKTLADVSHLFFSGAVASRDESAEDSDEFSADTLAGDSQPDAAPAKPGHTAGDDPRAARRPGPWSPTRVFVVTGGAGRPGKSTVAVNVAQVMTSRGRAALYDADPRIPNARFYLGLPSWNYLSPLTGEGEPAPNVLADSGLLVVDGTRDSGTLERGAGGGTTLSFELPSGDACPVDLVVVDCPVARAIEVARSGIGRSLETQFVVVAGPRERGFLEGYAALAALARDAGIRSAALVVNRALSTSYARAFHAKMKSAAERLLSVELVLLGGVVNEPGLGALQRERGVVVRSRPDATSALLLREIASNALGLREA